MNAAMQAAKSCPFELVMVEKRNKLIATRKAAKPIVLRRPRKLFAKNMEANAPGIAETATSK